MRSRSPLHILLVSSLLVASLALGLTPAASHSPLAVQADPVIYYVKPGGDGDCTSWVKACDLQAALTKTPNPGQIWVAAGTYKPTFKTDPENPRTATFQLKSGVAVYGGFAGTETALQQRNWTLNPTILSGDIGTEGDASDNAYHVVTGSGTDSTSVLDGFTITGGNADGDWDLSTDRGGGMYNHNGNPTLTNVTFQGNSAEHGGGMYNSNNSSPTLTDVVFKDNSASDSGGGMYNRDNSSPTLTDVTFQGNTADREGGGMYNHNSSPKLTNVTFHANSASSGGGMYNRDNSSPTLTDVTFSENQVNINGGGIYNWDSSPTLTDVTFHANSASSGGGMFNHNSSPTLTDVTFSENQVNINGGGMFNNNSSPTLTNVTFQGNSANWEGGGMANFKSSPSLADVNFSNNLAGTDGGGLSNLDSNPTLTGVSFTGNTAGERGGGLFNGGGELNLTNAVFLGNTAKRGGGIYNLECSPELTNISFYGNHASESGGGISNYLNSNPAITNAILWGNTAPSGSQIHKEFDSNPTVTYSIVQGGYEGVYNLSEDPLFIDPAAGNLRLLPDSSAIDAGDNAAISGVTTDLDGSPRIVNYTGIDKDSVDMGAYEAQLAGPIIYVDKNAPGLVRDGSSWTQAFTGLQPALAAASGGTHQIWVAAGTYYPGLIREATFQLKSGVAIYGGFSGTETALTQRNWTLNPTILSGDIGTEGDVSDNAYHVVTGSGTIDTAVLDGFTITGGYADGISPHDQGAGVYNVGGSPTLTNVTISANWAPGGGGGMYSSGGSPTLTNIIFRANQSQGGGGGMFVDGGSPTLTNVTFVGNQAPWGAGLYNQGSSLTLTNVTFNANQASLGGGLLVVEGSTLTLTNAILWGNTPDQIYNDDKSIPVVSYSIVEGPTVYPGEGNKNLDPLFIDPAAGNLRLQPTSPAIDAGNNLAVPPGVTTDLDGKPRFVNFKGLSLAAVDMGAYEAQVSQIFLPLLVR
jgi:predicted outer membrane repeat protein